MTQATNPPGWYPDGQGAIRWFDGVAWTERTQQPRDPTPAPALYQPGHNVPVPSVQERPPGPGAVLIRKQGAWGLWWLVVVTFGIYYYVWYTRINKELCAVLRSAVPADGQWWSQLIPIYNLIGLARTAKRVNAAHASVGSPTRVGVFVTWFWAAAWFASQTRYLQRRINILHDVFAASASRSNGAL